MHGQGEEMAKEMKEQQARISLIVLAAGESTRFGSNKLLFKIDGETLIESVVRKGIQSMADEVVVVVGYEADKIVEALKDLRCKIVVNHSFKEGQSSSVITGVKSVEDHAKAALILPGDMPLIRVEYINKVIDEYRSTASPLVVASYQGRMGHPILLDAELFDEVMEIKEQTHGLKEIVSRHIGDTRLVEVGSIGTLFDVDVRDDLKRIGRQ
jgi:molybdenum cofactor cytidylyltransferase